MSVRTPWSTVFVVDAASRWDQRWANADEPAEPSGILRQHHELLASIVDSPNFAATRGGRRPRAVDVAGGQGKNALWLASLGFSVTLVDVSSVALSRALDFAEDRSLAIETRQIDLESDLGSFTVDWDLLVVTAYLNRPLLNRVPELLAPGGLAIFAQPTTENLTKHERPSRRFLLDSGEVLSIADWWKDAGLDIVDASEAWRADDTHQGWLVAIKPQLFPSR